MRLFDIAVEARELKDLMIAFAEQHEGEIPDELEEALTINQEEMEEKLRNCFYIIEEWKVEMEALKIQIKKWQNRQKKISSSIDRMNEYIVNCLQLYGEENKNGNRFWQDPEKLFKVTATRRKSVALLNEEAIPDKFKEIVETVKISKKAIADAMKAGEEVDGARFVEKLNITFR